MTDAHVTKVLYGDRTLTGHDDADGERVEGWADVAYEAIRAMNHITNTADGIPAPVAYSVLGNLTGVAGMLPQLLEQLASGLERSLTEFDVYDHKREPAESVAAAQEALRTGRALASQLSDALSRAQVEINSQGWGRG